jgi:predicted nucleic acid-binding protein
MNILLDTSVIIDALNSRRGRRELIEQHNQAGDNLACCVISMAEVYAGMMPHEAGATDRFFQGLECIEISQEIARKGGLLKYEWARKGTTLDIPDAIISAVALSFNLTLATDNVKDFPMPELKLLPLPAA